MHPLVIEELELPRRGYRWTPAMGGYFVPFDDGSSIQLWDDEAKAERSSSGSVPGMSKGRHAMHALMHRVCDAIRPLGESRHVDRPRPVAGPDSRNGWDTTATRSTCCSNGRMAELMERYLTDERMQLAYMGQGVVGTFASPYDPGTASIYFHHYCGTAR